MAISPSPCEPRRCLIVEDDPSLASGLGDRLSMRYGGSLVVATCENAGKALEVWRGQTRPHAMVLDVMMPYGSAEAFLKGADDPGMFWTGIRLLELIRREEREGSLPPIWVAITTGRSPLAVDEKARALLAGRGEVYYKPFDSHRLEHELVRALGLESKVNPAFLRGVP